MFSSPAVRGRSRPRAARAPKQDAGDHVLELAAVDDHVEHAVLEQEFAALEAFGQLLTDGLFDDAGAGEADQGPGSAMLKSPSMAKLAVTPPVVGSVRTEI